MHPWEFDQYTWEDYSIRREGFYKRDMVLAERLHDEARLISYYAVKGHLDKADQKKPIDKIVPSKYRKLPKVDQKNVMELFEERMKKIRERDKNKVYNKQPAKKKTA